MNTCLSILIFFCFLTFINCEVDPDAHRNFTEIITSKGYPCETHYVTTDDGYILTVFRIPYGINGPGSAKRTPVLLQHGLLDSSFTWILNMPNQSLSYILADAGYDVWMGNNRGNKYSQKHTTLDPNSKEFWEFSWDEMGKYDMPNMMEYITSYTNFPRLGAYIGHSEGTTQAFAAFTSNNTLSSLTQGFVGLGPVITVNHCSGPLRLAADFDVADIWEIFGEKKFLPSEDQIEQTFLIDFCADCAICCSDVIELICGPHKGAFNESRMDVMAGHEPSETSVQNIVHWQQMVHTGKFQMYDYGYFGNKKHYGHHSPPQYDINNYPTNLPTALYTGTADILADPTDASELISQLPVANTYSRPINNYAHLDYIWALDSKTQIYDQVIQFIQSWVANPHK